jgi:GxxExxY protein
VEHEQLTETIIGCAMKLHRVLGPGFLESVYQNALAVELQRAGLVVELERPLEVRYEGVVVGHFMADMLIQNRVIVENKAVQSLVPAHEVQLVNYLTATGIEIGLLLNFGARSLEYKRRTRSHPRNPPITNPVNPVNPV